MIFFLLLRPELLFTRTPGDSSYLPDMLAVYFNYVPLTQGEMVTSVRVEIMLTYPGVVLSTAKAM